MRKFRILVVPLILAIAGLILLSGFCLAMEKHSCCPPQASDCPIVSVQEASSPDAVKEPKTTDAKSTPVSTPARENSVAPAAHKHSEVPDIILPNYHLLSMIAHQTTAPPQA